MGAGRALRFLVIWDGTPGQSPMLALLRSAVTDEQAADSLRAFFTRVLLTPLAQAAGDDRLELRANLVASQMVGLAVARYVVRLEPLASAVPDDLAPALGTDRGPVPHGAPPLTRLAETS